MNLYRSLEAVATASGDGTIDWSAAGTAAKSAIPPGSIALDPGEHDGYAGDVRDARDTVRSVSGLDFDVPSPIEIQTRHHWIDANIDTFARVMAPLEDQPAVFAAVTQKVNTATMATMLSFLGNHVLGQYDPVLLADGDHGLYFVRPNIKTVTGELDVEYDRFRRWIAFHEVTHAAEFGAAPWLSEYLEVRMEDVIESLANGRFDRDTFREIDVVMTAIEGYAEFIMDRAFDADYRDLREKVDARRAGGGPIAAFVRRLLGLGIKRDQYERGKAFFDAIADDDGIAITSRVWSDPQNLPTRSELEDPRAWRGRVL